MIAGIILAATAAALFMAQGDSPIEEKPLPEPYEPPPTPLPRPKELRAWGEEALRMNQIDPGSVPAFPGVENFCKFLSSNQLMNGAAPRRWMFSFKKEETLNVLKQNYAYYQLIATENPLAAEDYDSPCLRRFYYYSQQVIPGMEPPQDLFRQWSQQRMDLAENYSGRHDPFRDPEFELTYIGLRGLSRILEEKTFKEGLLAVSQQAVDTDAFLEDKSLRSLLKSATTEDLDRLQQLLKKQRTELAFLATLTAEEWPGAPRLFSQVLAYLPRDSETEQRRFVLKLFFYLDSLLFIRKAALNPLAKESCRLDYQRLFGEDCPFFESLRLAIESEDLDDDIRMNHRVREAFLKYFKAYPLLKSHDLVSQEFNSIDLSLRVLLRRAIRNNVLRKEEIQTFLETGQQLGLQWGLAHSTGKKDWPSLVETVEREKIVALSPQDFPPVWKEVLRGSTIHVPFENGTRRIQLDEYLEKNLNFFLLTNGKAPTNEETITTGLSYYLTSSATLWLDPYNYKDPWYTLSIIFHEAFHNEDIRNQVQTTSLVKARLLDERNAYLFESYAEVGILNQLLKQLVQREVEQTSAKGKSMTAQEVGQTVLNRLKVRFRKYVHMINDIPLDSEGEVSKTFLSYFGETSGVEHEWIKLALRACENRINVHASNAALGYAERDKIIRTQTSTGGNPELFDSRPGKLAVQFLKNRASLPQYYMEVYDEISPEISVH